MPAACSPRSTRSPGRWAQRTLHVARRPSARTRRRGVVVVRAAMAGAGCAGAARAALLRYTDGRPGGARRTPRRCRCHPVQHEVTVEQLGGRPRGRCRRLPRLLVGDREEREVAARERPQRCSSTVINPWMPMPSCPSPPAPDIAVLHQATHGGCDQCPPRRGRHGVAEQDQPRPRLPSPGNVATSGTSVAGVRRAGMPHGRAPRRASRTPGAHGPAGSRYRGAGTQPAG
jgi:hypothetical protein